MISVALSWWLVAAAPAAATDGDAPWWVGLPLADVQLRAGAVEGSLPEETLEPLLRAQQGDPLDALRVQLDLVTLFQVGEFSAVEAEVEPWVAYDADGEPIAAVLLTYVVYPAPKVGRVRVQGNRVFRDRPLLDALGVAPGQAFYDDIDAPFVEDRAESWLFRRGYDQAQVQVRSTQPVPGEVFVVAVVDEGPPHLLERLVFAGDLEGVATDRQLRRWARQAGVAEGRPLAPDAINKAQDALRERLGSVQSGWFRQRRGYLSARVTPVVVSGPSGTQATFTVEPGPRLDLVVDGLGWSGRRQVKAALGIDHRLRLTRGFLDQADDRLVQALQEQGWLEATAEVALAQPDDQTQALEVRVVRGARHGIGDTPNLVFVDFEFDFDEPARSRRGRRREEAALQAVFDQASPDGIRRDIYTEAELQKGLAAARLFYVDQGHLDAELAADAPERHPRPSIGNVWRQIAGRALRVKVTPRITVRPGPVTVQDDLIVAGAVATVDTAFVERDRQARIGEPFSPQRVEALARRLVEVHRDAGYLEADARVLHEPTRPLGRRSTIAVEPGPQVILRSVVTRGTRLTRPSFVQNEVDLPLGQPVTGEDLDRVRADLYDLGIFRTVSLDLLGDEEARDLVVGLAERSRYAFEFGGGLSTDQGVRLFGRVSRRNLFGVGHRLDLLGQIGLDYRSEDLRDWLPDVTDPEWRAATSYTIPRVFRRSELVLDVVLRERRQERTWRMDRTGGGVALDTRFQPECQREDRASCPSTRLRIGTRLETRRLDEVDTAALLPGEPWAELLAAEPLLPTRWRMQESVIGLLVHDLRDDPVLPRSGALLSGNSEWAPGLPWDEVRDQPRTSFLKGEARLSGYVPLSGFTLHVALGGGVVRSFGGLVPLEDRFRMGGTGSLRGFVRDAVGPQNVAPRVVVDWPNGIGPVVDYVLRDDPERWTPTGGDTNASGTIELLMPLPALGLASWEGYSAGLFTDVGNVWLFDPEARTSSQLPQYAGRVPFLRVGLGAGMRIATPIGPLSLDVALNPQAATATGRRRALLVGAWEEPAVRAHLTLGAVW